MVKKASFEFLVLKNGQKKLCIIQSPNLKQNSLKTEI